MSQHILWVYVGLLSFYHIGEFVLTKRIHGRAHFSALLISVPYLLAQAIAILEYELGWKYMNAYKGLLIHYLWLPGFILCVIGLTMRFASILTAQKSFTHAIQIDRRKEHQLITTGIYSWSRHPAYFGWFVWALASQILLSNPISFLLFWFWSWVYFKKRIELEEEYLFRFFGDEYLQYKSKTPVRIPFIP
ncbi:MAG: isoprenylcysteine carboxylmethyltransferase family protein [Saprospiraceae bacterium]|nr:isoprenylcysteine carboxylmethyltransferase family protein [Saprospiraceae bacterium]